jgi:hypothetical protein
MDALGLAIALTLTSAAPAQARPAAPRSDVRLTAARAIATRIKDESVQSAAPGRPMPYRVLVPKDYDATTSSHWSSPD